LDAYVYAGGKKLRKGFTTGTCAAAASAGAVRALLGGEQPKEIMVTLPGGEEICLKVENIESLASGIRCSIRKDAGDDPDITDGMLICSFAEVLEADSISGTSGSGLSDADQNLDHGFPAISDSIDVLIDGGEGVGRVTRPGLDQPVGMAAINSVPRRMIKEAVLKEARDTGFSGRLKITISIPGGEEAAKKTFNPRLGVEGGLSILGTSGIVEPMSDEAIIETIRLLISQRLMEDGRYLLVTPGNYGKDFIQNILHIESSRAVLCSNYIGQTIDIARGEGAEGLLLCGHVVKLCKLASGIMNTHSRVADGRQDVFCSCALLAGSDKDTALKMLECITSEEALCILQEAGLIDPFMDVLMKRIEEKLTYRAGSGMKIAAIVFANERRILGKTSSADELLALIRR
jgi:cobalt-precorrin-5B (C1)-methyltransferase